MNQRRKIKQIIVLITLPFVLLLFFNQVAYWHYHILENGLVVEHAHPYKNNTIPDYPFQKHHHSDFEYTLLAQISQLAGILIFFVLASYIFFTSAHQLLLQNHAIFLQHDYLEVKNPRGPPYFTYSS